jgi:hypothetical protein
MPFPFVPNWALAVIPRILYLAVSQQQWHKSRVEIWARAGGAATAGVDVVTASSAQDAGSHRARPAHLLAVAAAGGMVFRARAGMVDEDWYYHAAGVGAVAGSHARGSMAGAGSIYSWGLRLRVRDHSTRRAAGTAGSFDVSGWRFLALGNASRRTPG